MKTSLLTSSALALLLSSQAACISDTEPSSSLSVALAPTAVSIDVGSSGSTSLQITADPVGPFTMFATPSDPDIFTVDSFESDGTGALLEVTESAGTQPGERYYEFDVDDSEPAAYGTTRFTCLAAGSGTLEFLVVRLVGGGSDEVELPVECNPRPVGFQVTPESVSQTHLYGTSSCPQEIATVTIANNTTAPVDWTFDNNGLAVSSPMSSGTLAAGENVEVVLAFECDPAGVDGVVTFTAGDTTAQVTVRVAVDGAP